MDSPLLHYWYWEFLEVFGTNEALNMASYLCLEIVWTLVAWYVIVAVFQ